MTPNDPEALQVAFLVLDVVESLGRRYHLGGSYASSIHGMPRQTHGIDIVCELQQGDTDRLVAAISDDFYCDRDRIAQAISRHGSFNLVYLKTGVKIVLFPMGNDGFNGEGLERSQMLELGSSDREPAASLSRQRVVARRRAYRNAVQRR